MEYSKLISVTGLGGLFELMASKTDGAIVKSLDDKSTKFVSSRQHSFSHLESIEVYTVRDNVNLVDVFTAMGASSEALPFEKDAAAIKAYFSKVYPDLDFERVYASDMKKMVRWFDILKKNDVEIKLREEAAEDEFEETEAAAEEAVKKEKPAEKKAAKKKEVVAEEAVATEEVPKKKAAPKKKKSEE
ncbi:hypothetical protein BH10BAC2_BH10BAC2_14160 [soil metagenome]